MAVNNYPTEKKVFDYYVMVSMAVYVLFYFLPTFLFPNILNLIPKDYYFETVRPSDAIIFFFIILPCFMFRKPDYSVRAKPDINFIMIHLLSLIVFALFLISVIDKYPFQPLNPEGIFMKIFQIFNRKAMYLSGRFRAIYFIITVGGHYALLFSIFKGKVALWRYSFAMGLAFFFAEFANLIHLEFLINYATWGEYFMLKISGFKTQLYFLPGKAPIVGTDVYKASVVYGCSGWQGMVYFWVALTVVSIFSWHKLNKIRAVVLAVAGTFIMSLVNILRIHSIILAGHFRNSKDVVQAVHKYGGMFFYIIAISIIMRVSYRWLVAETPKKITEKT